MPASATRCWRSSSSIQAFADGLLVQAAIAGALERTQAVFDAGASSPATSIARSPKGPAAATCSRSASPGRRPATSPSGSGRHWRGTAPLSFDYILDEAATPFFIDANPRLVEPMNAWLSGTDLPGRVAAGFTRRGAANPRPRPRRRPDPARPDGAAGCRATAQPQARPAAGNRPDRFRVPAAIAARARNWCRC